MQQAFTWDCGLACVLMVLRTLGIHCCDGIADLERLCRTTRFYLYLGLEYQNFKYKLAVQQNQRNGRQFDYVALNTARSESRRKKKESSSTELNDCFSMIIREYLV